MSKSCHKACQNWPSCIHLWLAVLLAIFGYIMFCADIRYGAHVVIFLVDVYLISLIWCCTCGSSGEPSTYPGLPDRKHAFFMLPFIFVALVFAFGALYLNTVVTDCQTKAAIVSHFDAAYASLSNFATFTYESNAFSTRPAKVIAAAQIASGILLLICAFPLFISRIANFGGGMKQITFNNCKIFLPDTEGATVTIDDNSFKWCKDNKEVEVTKESGGSMKVKSTDKPAGDDLKEILVINPDASYHCK